MTARAGKSRAGWRAIPAGVWALGFVSLLMDTSSEMIHALLPVYLVTVLGASALTVGLIEGIAESTAAITKIFSGALSDRLGKRKVLAAFGYGLAALTKPIFPLATTVEMDRCGTLRRPHRQGHPRRAARRAGRRHQPARTCAGASFGLRQSLDTVGAFLGPLAAIALMWLTVDRFRTVFWIAVVPAFLSFALIVFAVREPARPEGVRRVRMPLSRTRDQPPRRDLLVGRRRRRRLLAGPVQRGVPGLARPVDRRRAHRWCPPSSWS